MNKILKCLAIVLAMGLISRPAAAVLNQTENPFTYQLSLPRQALLDRMSSQNRRLDQRVQAIMYLRDKDESAALLFWTLTNASGTGRIPWLLIHGPGRIDWNKMGSELTPKTMLSILKFAANEKMFEIFDEALILPLFLGGEGYTSKAFLDEVFALAKEVIPKSSSRDADEISDRLLLLLERAQFEGNLKEEHILQLIAVHAVIHDTYPDQPHRYLPFGLRRAYEGDMSRHLHLSEAAPGSWKNFEKKSHLIPDDVIHTKTVLRAIDAFLEKYEPKAFEREWRLLELSGTKRCEFLL